MKKIVILKSGAIASPEENILIKRLKTMFPECEIEMLFFPAGLAPAEKSDRMPTRKGKGHGH